MDNSAQSSDPTTTSSQQMPQVPATPPVDPQASATTPPDQTILPSQSEVPAPPLSSPTPPPEVPAQPSQETPPPPPAMPADPTSTPVPEPPPAPIEPPVPTATEPSAPPVADSPMPQTTPSTPTEPMPISSDTPTTPEKTDDSKPAPSLAGNQTPPPPIQPKTKHWHISPWTLILLLVLAGFSGFFLYIALAPKTSAPQVKQQATIPLPKPLAHSVLSLQPVPSGTQEAQLKTETYNVIIDTDVNTVNTVELELSYDPSVLTNVSVTPGTFFTNPLQLVKDLDTQNGRISYALGIQPKDKGVKGSGIVAQVMFQFQPTATVSSTMLKFLPKTLVAAQGVNPSVLKSTTDVTIQVPGKGTSVTTTPVMTPVPTQ